MNRTNMTACGGVNKLLLKYNGWRSIKRMRSGSAIFPSGYEE